MEVESHSEDENFECQKRRLFDTAEWTLQRLNQTINEMKSWSREREILTSDIHRLKIALGYSEKLLGDPLVMHQSQEIHRLERMNNDMRIKVESMSVALMNAERTVSWNVERKYRSEMAAFKCQVAEEKLHLAREIARLRSRLNEAEVDCTLYHDIRGKLDEYVEGDRHVDAIIAEGVRKLIDTVWQLSELIKTARDSKIGENKIQKVEENISQSNKSLVNGIEEISNKVVRLQEEKQVLLTEMETKINKNFMEKELKVKVLRRVASSLRTKLTISLERNKKLCERLNDSGEIQERGNACVQTSENGLNHNNELMKIIDINEKLMDQLEIERTTTREALKEFEKSVKETEGKDEEIKKLQTTLFSIKKDLKKIKIKNKLTKKINKKLFFNRIKILKIKNNKLITELKKYKEQLVIKEETINLLESEKNYLVTENFDLSKKIEENVEIMKIEVFSQTSEILNDKIIEINVLKNEELPKIEEKMMRGHWTIKNKFLRDSTPDVIMRNLEETDRELSEVKSELSSVKSEIGSLRRELESRRSKNFILERENVSLKEDLRILRGKIMKVQEEKRGLMQLERLRGKL